MEMGMGMGMGMGTEMEMATETEMATGDGDGDGDGNGDGDGDGDGDADVCEAAPNDTTCITCTKQACCPELEACFADVACTCAFQCLALGGNALTCQSDCNANNDVSNDALTCGQDNCLAQCV